MIYIFDLDDTISFDGQTIDSEIIQATQALESRGNKVIFASARPVRDMLPLLKENFEHNFYIGGNGSVVKNGEMTEIVKAIDAESLEVLKTLVSDYDLDYLFDSEWNYSLKNRNDALAQINDKIDNLGLARNIAMAEMTEVIKCNLLNIPTDLEEVLLSKIKELPLSMVRHQGMASFDLTAQNINKFSTFRKYFPEAEYIAFGNDANDKELLQGAKRAIVVGDSQDLKAIGEVFLEPKPHELAKYISEI